MNPSTPSGTGSPSYLPWQQSVWDQLQQLLDEEKLPHALLLEGPIGTGRGSFANAFVRQLLCENPDTQGACGVCKACTLTASGAHSDLLYLQPEEAGKSIGIDAVRHAIRFVGGTAALGLRKALVVNPAEAMTTAAFNAFLKCLEEPTKDTHIVLVAPSGYPLPATIRSRCQRWKLSAPDLSDALAWLLDSAESHDLSVDRDGWTQLLAITGNRPVQAMTLAAGGDMESLLALHSHATGARPLQAVQVEVLAQKLDSDNLLEALETLVQTSLREKDLPQLRSDAGFAGFRALDVLRDLRGARRAGSNPNPELLQFSAIQACIGLWQ